MHQHSLYSSIYILRVWRDRADNDSLCWRFAVEDTATGDRYGFSDLGALARFIETRAEASFSTDTSATH